MSTGAKNMGLYYIVSLKQNQGPQNNCNASYTNPFQLKIC